MTNTSALLPPLISADKVKGTPVHNPEGESLGTIENIMIDKPSGKVAYAVLALEESYPTSDPKPDHPNWCSPRHRPDRS